jgi:hypothetical protein
LKSYIPSPIISSIHKKIKIKGKDFKLSLSLPWWTLTDLNR